MTNHFAEAWHHYCDRFQLDTPAHNGINRRAAIHPVRDYGGRAVFRKCTSFAGQSPAAQECVKELAASLANLDAALKESAASQGTVVHWE